MAGREWTREGKRRFFNALQQMGDLVARSRPNEPGLQGLKVKTTDEPIIVQERDMTVPREPIELEGRVIECLG